MATNSNDSAPEKKTPRVQGLAWLFDDSRSLKKRLLLSVLICAALVFTVLIVGPLSLFASNPYDLTFVLGDFLPALLLQGVIVFLVLATLLVLCRGKVFDAVLCLFTGLLVACFLQATCINEFLGGLIDDAISVSEYNERMLINLLLWLAIMVAVFIIRFANTKVWLAATVLIAPLLLLVQVVGLFNLSDDIADANIESNNGLILSTEGFLEVSSQKNVIVFLLDRLDARYVAEVRENDPGFFDELDGFTEYPDNMTRYLRTFPSVSYSLTGQTQDYNLEPMEHFEQAYSQHLFIDDLIAEGWESKLYLGQYYDFGSMEEMRGRADNLVDLNETSQTGNLSFLESLEVVAAFDYLSVLWHAPTGFKVVPWMSPDGLFERQGFNGFYSQISLMENLKDLGLKASTDNPVFMYYHLDGPHPPHSIDAEGNPVPEGSSTTAAVTEGCFTIIYEYIKQLKELGVYEDTCIIITGDHGFHGEYPNLGTSITGLFYKPAGAANTPLQQSMAPVSDANLVPTIIEQSGVSSTALAAQGLSYAQVTPENTPVRLRDERVEDEENPEVDTARYYTYEVRGLTSDPDNWHLVKEEEYYYYVWKPWEWIWQL